MSDWRKLHEEDALTVGMWQGDNTVYFTYELDAHIGNQNEIEFGVDIKDLEHILEEAKKCSQKSNGSK